MNEPLPNCAGCTIPFAERFCRVERGKAPKDCPSGHYRNLAQEIFAETPAEEKEFMRQTMIEEAAGYLYRPEQKDVLPAKTRIEETIGFAKRMGYKKLGLVSCVAMHAELPIIKQIFEINGFEVISVACKVGRQPKVSFGVKPEEFVNPGLCMENACNPRLQAVLMNRAKVDFNILIGLCVGHDSVVFKHLDAPVTVLIAKDRVLAHNPMGAVYMLESSYAFLKKPLEPEQL